MVNEETKELVVTWTFKDFEEVFNDIKDELCFDTLTDEMFFRVARDVEYFEDSDGISWDEIAHSFKRCYGIENQSEESTTVYSEPKETDFLPNDANEYGVKKNYQSFGDFEKIIEIETVGSAITMNRLKKPILGALLMNRKCVVVIKGKTYLLEQ